MRKFQKKSSLAALSMQSPEFAIQFAATFNQVQNFVQASVKFSALQQAKFTQPITQDSKVNFGLLFQWFTEAKNLLSELLDAKKHNQKQVKKIFSEYNKNGIPIDAFLKGLGLNLLRDMASIFQKPGTDIKFTKLYEELFWQAVIVFPPNQAPFFILPGEHERARARVAELLLARNKLEEAIKLLKALIGPPVCSSKEVYQESISSLFDCYIKLITTNPPDKEKTAQLLPQLEKCKQKLHEEKMITPERCFELSDIYRLAFNLDQKPDYLVARVKHMEEAINLANKTQGYPTDQGSPYSMACSLLGRFYLSGIQNRLTPNITTAKKFFKLSNELLARMGLVAFMEKNSQEFQEEIFKRANEKDIESCVYMVSFLHTKESNADYFDQYKLYLPAWIETIRQSDHKNVLLELIQQPKQIPKSTDEENPAIDAKIEQKSIAVKFFAPDEIGASISEVLGKLETAPDFFVQLAISVKKSVRFRYALIQHLPQLKNLWLKLLIYWQASPGLLTQDQVKKSTSLLISLNSLGISTQVVVLGDLSIHLASLLVLSPLEDKNMLAKVVYNLCLGQILRNPADFRIFFLLLEQAKEAWFELTPKYKCLLFYGLFVLHTQDNTSGAYRDSILSAVIQFAKILEGHNPASHYDQEDREMPIIAMQSAWAYEYFTRLKEKDFNAKQLQPIKAYYQYLKGMGFDYELKPNPSAMQQDMYKLLLAFCSDVKSEHRIAVKSAIIVDYFFENGKIIGQFDPLQHFLWTDDGKQIPAPRTVARDKICQLRGFKKIVIFTPEDLAQYKPGNWDALIRGFCLLQKKLAPYRNLTLEEFDPQAIAPKSKESKQGRGVKITPSSSLGYNQRQFFKPASDLAPLDSKQEIAICLSTLKEHFAPEVWADCNSFYRQAKIEDNQLALDYLLQQLQIKIKILPEVVGSAVSVRTPAGMVSFTG